MKVLIACEESQVACKAFRKRGHEAYSCDTEPCSGGHPEWHIQEDVMKVMDEDWDMIIAFPPCTYLTNASAVRMRVKGKIQEDRYRKMLKAKSFFYSFYNHPCQYIAIENPVPLKLCELPPYDQIIQPWQFGHPYSKKTCLWLKGLPLLKPTRIIEKYKPYINGGCKDSKGNYRKFQGRNERDPKTRSKTFTGIAEAMAEQWGGWYELF